MIANTERLSIKFRCFLWFGELYRKHQIMKKHLSKWSLHVIVLTAVWACSKEDASDGLLRKSELILDIDLSTEEGSGLANKGSFILRKNIVIVKNLEGKGGAASHICSHDKSDQIRFTNVNGGTFHCSRDGARFNQSGYSVNQITASQLKIYNAVVEDNMLKIYE